MVVDNNLDKAECCCLPFLIRLLVDETHNNYINNLRGDKSLIIAMESMNAADITTQHDKFVQGLVLCVSKIDFHAPIISGNTELKRSREKQRLKIQGSVTHDG